MRTKPSRRRGGGLGAGAGSAARRIMGALLLMYLAMSAAAAQTWLAATDPGRSDLGPDIAKGAVIWSHGRALTAEDWQSPTPAYVAALRKGGWDTFRFNRWREGDTLPASADALVGYVRELKARGYAQVVLAGQSYGAFLSLMAAAADSDDIAAVIATAPAAFGSFSDSYDTWRRNASALYPLLESVRSRVMMFYFHGDDYDPGGRGNRSEEILAARQVEHLVIDQPADLTGHWASTSPRFVERFGRCILGFIDGDVAQLGPSCGTAPVRVAGRPLPVTRKSGGASAR